LVGLCLGIANVQAETWVEDSYADFADGRLDASGQNIYVSRDGKVRTIHRFDLNADGHLDLIFNSTHDEYSYIPAAMCTVTRDRQVTQSPLAVEGSNGVALGDLNRDGWADLVFCPNPSGIQNQRRFVTVIHGGPDGWPARRSQGILPVHGAQAVALADLNCDEWPDIVILNSSAWLYGQPAGCIIRIFWGGPHGCLLSRRQDIGVPGALALAAADLDGDGGADVAVLTSDKKVCVLWSTKSDETPTKIDRTTLDLPAEGAQCLTAGDVDGDRKPDLVAGTNKGRTHIVPGQEGRGWGDVVAVKSFNATHVAVGDLDGDARPDLVLSNFSLALAAGGEVTGAGKDVADAVRILWGDASGFSAARSTKLTVGFPSAAAIGDLDGDGHADLAVAVFQAAETFAAESAIFFGQGNRRFARGKRGVRTEGAKGVAITPAKGKLPARAVFCNSRGGRLHEAVPLFVYWGGPNGFDPKRRWDIPFAGGYESSAADLNADGFVDLVAMNSGHGGRSAAGAAGHQGANIFWGGPEGFDLDKRRTVLPHFGLWASNVADLNRDGWLDLVLGAFGPDTPGQPVRTIIYYGSSHGFDSSRQALLTSKGRSGGCAIADFNKDDWLDVAVTSFEADRVRIFWGSAKGFDEARQARLDVPNPIALETADLNADGHLDLITSGYYDRLAHHHDTGTIIFWGTRAGFRHWDAQGLPGFTATGHAVADFDGDGHLDLFTPHYHGDVTRESMPCYLYWGGPDGFGTRRRTILICDSADDALAGDFDRDGKLDLAVVCHTVDGNHNTVSRVFYNDGRRFTDPRVVTLPTHGAHWMWIQDMGHIYDRTWRQRYESSVFRWERPVGSLKLTHRADVPTGTRLTFEVRAAAEPTGLARQAWRAVGSGRSPLKPSDRCLQYRAVFASDNGDRYPVLDRVRIELMPD